LQQLRQGPQDKGSRWVGISVLAAGLIWAGTAVGCDIALALAVDVSGSVDDAEYRLQMQGLADGLRDATVADALIKAKAQVMLVQWTGDQRQEVSIGWTAMDSATAPEAFARKVESAPRAWRNYSTAIGAALAFTRAAFSAAPPCRRQVIDLSGDGSSNEGIAPQTLRSGLWRDGFTVNGLAIEGSEPDLTAYYWEHVIAGENAFVVTANGFADYPARIKLKLLREVTEQISQTDMVAKRRYAGR